ncbi:hypothetical protein GCM10027176_00960 [Actinoallomurus bryophytorum]|uniref:Uncharacterized protein DUF202 n=1 Tax=Actinoallomurus bryophytorum TaxID=1490222 RepID=A0A543CEH2_9ACTN|nr:DUF202 domain-containing protein [Actinoallomurus bryophytorum]TQL95479.1 uncharacterized protein DUF202 [Actinoallomurus bryophytorum]
MSAGLQRQRTDLAWLRLVLASWAVVVLTARVALPVGVLALMGPVAVTAIAQARRRRLRGDGTPPTLSRGAAVLMVAACVLTAVAEAVRL